MSADWGLVHREVEGIEGIGVDEMAYSKGHKYFIIVYQIDQDMRRLIWIGSERTEKTFHEFFD
jgi:transposase